jgi:RHS repeat-associated protein
MGGFSPYLYTGQLHDSESNLYYYGARYYDSNYGLFISLDPVRDGVNPYGYARSNPVRFTDPRGLAATDDQLKQMMALSNAHEGREVVLYNTGEMFVSESTDWVAYEYGSRRYPIAHTHPDPYLLNHKDVRQLEGISRGLGGIEIEHTVVSAKTGRAIDYVLQTDLESGLMNIRVANTSFRNIKWVGTVGFEGGLAFVDSREYTYLVAEGGPVYEIPQGGIRSLYSYINMRRLFFSGLSLALVGASYRKSFAAVSEGRSLPEVATTAVDETAGTTMGGVLVHRRLWEILYKGLIQPSLSLPSSGAPVSQPFNEAMEWERFWAEVDE